MQRFAWLGMLLAGAVLWTVTLFISRYFAAPQQEVNLVLSTLAVSTPAFLLALLAHRFQLARPLLNAVLAYCVGSAVVTGLLHRLEATHAVPVLRSLEAALIHLVSATLFVPGNEGGYAFVWANFLWLAMAGLVASIFLEAFATKFGAQPAPGGKAPAQPGKKSSPAARRALRPRRKPTAGNGTDRHE